jgi:uncharacterized repeat protein (TIGR02059 family)
LTGTRNRVVLLLICSLVLQVMLQGAFLNASTVNAATGDIQPIKGFINGNTVSLQFSEKLKSINASPYAYTQFTVISEGSGVGVVSAISGDDYVVLTLSKTLTDGQPLSIGYYPGAYPLVGLTGTAVKSFTDFYIGNGTDTKVPVMQNIAFSGNQMTLTYDEWLKASELPQLGQFVIIADGKMNNVISVVISNKQVILTMATTMTTTQDIHVHYLGGTPGITDLAGNPAPAFTNAVLGSVAGSTAVIAAIANGSEIRLIFSQPLNNNGVPISGQFAVKVQGVTRSVVGASVVSPNVTLQLYSPVKANETVTISYFMIAGTGLTNSNGQNIGSFTDFIASNQTSLTSPTTGGGTVIGGGTVPGTTIPGTFPGGIQLPGGTKTPTGVDLNLSAAQASTSEDISPGDRPSLRYTLTPDKITSAYQALRSQSAGTPRVVFTVPSSENAAIVAVPIYPLNQALEVSKDASFAIQFKDITYEIPLQALNYTQFADIIMAGGSEGYLLIEIDTDGTNVTRELGTALKNSNAAIVYNPVHFQISAVSGSKSAAIDDFTGYLTRKIKTPAQLDPRQTAAVWLDPETGELSYVPTHVERTGNESVVTFKRPGNSAYAVIKGTISYPDILQHWAKNDILLLANKYIAAGRTITAFEPEKPITRGEFATFIAKGLGLSGNKKAAEKFKDVNGATAIAAYIGAAFKAGIVLGNEDGTFKPDSPITREQMSSMVVRAAKAGNVNILLSQAKTSYLQKFDDQKSISSWATMDVAKALHAGIVNGITANSFSPKSNATRAQAVVMIKRLLAYMKFLEE